MTGLVTLACPSCRGTLYLMQDDGLFTCIHCGKEHSLEQHGGIVPAACPGEPEPGDQPFAGCTREVPPATEDSTTLVAEEQVAEAGGDEVDVDPAIRQITVEIDELVRRRTEAQDHLDSLRLAAQHEPQGIRLPAVLLAMLSTSGLIIFLAAVPASSTDGSQSLSTLRDVVWLVYLLTLSPIVLALVRRGAYNSNWASRDNACALVERAISSLDTQIADKSAELEVVRRLLAHSMVEL